MDLGRDDLLGSHGLAQFYLVFKQLTEFFTVQVTEVVGYRVVPRDQLASKLADKKKGSYTHKFALEIALEPESGPNTSTASFTRVFPVTE